MYDSTYTLQTNDTYISSKLKDMLASYDKNSQNNFVFIWDENDLLIYVSNQMKAQTAMSGANINPEKWMDILSKSTVSDIQNHFNETDEQLALSNIELSLDEQKEQVFNGFVSPFVFKGDVFYICQLANDNTPLEWKNFLVDLEKLILSSQMTASLVHEIRNPLTSLKGFLQLVQSGIEQREEYYKVIINEIEKLEQITMELLQMSRPKNDEKREVCVNHIIDDVVFLLETQMDMKNIDFEVHIEGKLYVECHTSQIKQVLINLIKNGAEAMEKKGTLKIHVFEKHEEIYIEVIDEGTGISSDAVKELNNPFYTTKMDGTGLGLVVTNHILTDHHGQLKVRTEENEGTIFTVVLPAKQPK